MVAGVARVAGLGGQTEGSPQQARCTPRARRRSRARGRVGPVLHLGDRVGVVGQPARAPAAGGRPTAAMAHRPSGSSTASTMRATVPTSVRTSSPPTSLPRSISTTPNSRSSGQAVVDQRPVARLEHVQRQPGRRHQHGAEREHRERPRQPIRRPSGRGRRRRGRAASSPAPRTTCCCSVDRRRRGRAPAGRRSRRTRTSSGGSSSSTIPASDATEVSEPVLRAEHALERRCPRKRSASVPDSPATGEEIVDHRPGAGSDEHVDEELAGDPVVEGQPGAVDRPAASRGPRTTSATTAAPPAVVADPVVRPSSFRRSSAVLLSLSWRSWPTTSTSGRGLHRAQLAPPRRAPRRRRARRRRRPRAPRAAG